MLTACKLKLLCAYDFSHSHDNDNVAWLVLSKKFQTVSCSTRNGKIVQTNFHPKISTPYSRAK